MVLVAKVLFPYGSGRLDRRLRYSQEVFNKVEVGHVARKACIVQRRHTV
jgi:hypothetical protein